MLSALIFAAALSGAEPAEMPSTAWSRAGERCISGRPSPAMRFRGAALACEPRKAETKQAAKTASKPAVRVDGSSR